MSDNLESTPKIGPGLNPDVLLVIAGSPALVTVDLLAPITVNAEEGVDAIGKVKLDFGAVIVAVTDGRALVVTVGTTISPFDFENSIF